MIVREAIDKFGEPVFQLIFQTAHAHVSGRFAEAWGAGPFLDLPCRVNTLPAIYHHDDGWDQWDPLPRVDPETGRPMSFLDMPHEEAETIWRHSIDAVAPWGPLAQYIVARHFSILRSESHSANTPGGRAFLYHYEKKCAYWLAGWMASDRDRSEERAQRALEELRFFDWISLWFCIAERTEPHQMETPDKIPLQIQPQGDGRFTISPWPWKVNEIDLSIMAREIPRKSYSSDKALQAEQGRITTLRWELVPGG
ncbi:DUF3891 family protein [Blastopirellula retiformator]|uniref:DUF3891 domain-containing protein n=1 Tax=Blastopirellula retiformator TaxID=2527970 RepID=A0A5C5V5K9_9BACT|nr:DUF3891 family protein [Blastopirellula retiformator]TWT33025.1 hypothetical protein Enr8_28450 [Blastopirellula retiformator]